MKELNQKFGSWLDGEIQGYSLWQLLAVLWMTLVDMYIVLGLVVKFLVR